jgi:hypothetical protein
VAINPGPEIYPIKIMEKFEKYKYHFRPQYGSDKLIIEFITGVANKNFGRDFLDAIKEISPKVAEQDDLWINDEILYLVYTNLGSFTLSKDVWDLAFIIGENNQICLIKINDLLTKDKRFEKVDFDGNDYKLTEKASH